MNELVFDTTRTSHRDSIEYGSRLMSHRRIVLLTDGFSTPFLAKTAISMLRYRQDDIVAVLDSTELGKRSGEFSVQLMHRSWTRLKVWMQMPCLSALLRPAAICPNIGGQLS